jgi:hypothetical protein
VVTSADRSMYCCVVLSLRLFVPSPQERLASQGVVKIQCTALLHAFGAIPLPHAWVLSHCPMLGCYCIASCMDAIVLPHVVDAIVLPQAWVLVYLLMLGCYCTASCLGASVMPHVVDAIVLPHAWVLSHCLMLGCYPTASCLDAIGPPHAWVLLYCLMLGCCCTASCLGATVEVFRGLLDVAKALNCSPGAVAT